jgi:hypothetical protein
MSNIDFLAKALSYHTKGKDADFLKEAKDYNKDGKIDDHEKDHDKEEDRFEKIEKDVKSLKKEEVSASDMASAGRSQPAKAGNAKAHALSKASDEAQPKSKVSLKKAPWDEETKVSEEALTEAEEVALEIIESLEGVYDQAIHLQGLLEHLGYDLDELFTIEEDADEEMQEGFANVSKAKRLIAQRKAAMMRRLRTGSKPNVKKPVMPKR